MSPPSPTASNAAARLTYAFTASPIDGDDEFVAASQNDEPRVRPRASERAGLRDSGDEPEPAPKERAVRFAMAGVAPTEEPLVAPERASRSTASGPSRGLEHGWQPGVGMGLERGQPRLEDQLQMLVVGQQRLEEQLKSLRQDLRRLCSDVGTVCEEGTKSTAMVAQESFPMLASQSVSPRAAYATHKMAVSPSHVAEEQVLGESCLALEQATRGTPNFTASPETHYGEREFEHGPLPSIPVSWPRNIEPRSYQSDAAPTRIAKVSQVAATYIADDDHGAFAPGSEGDKAWDGDCGTFYDSAAASEGWTAGDLGSRVVISKIKYAARSEMEERMVGGVFEGTNDIRSSRWELLHRITEHPLDNPNYNSAIVTITDAFRYVRYRGPEDGHCNVADISVYGSKAVDSSRARSAQKISADFEAGQPHRRRKRFMLDPKSGLRLYFDILSMIVLVYDLTIFPVLVAWDFPFEGYVMISSFLSLGFWIIDMLLNFRTGVYLKDRLEIQPLAVAKIYLMKRFWLDLVVVAADMTAVVFGILAVHSAAGSSGESVGASSTAGVQVTRVIKLGRVLRIIRVLRFAQLNDFFVRMVLGESKRLQNWMLFMDMLRTFASLMWINHTIGCFWNFVGRVHADSNSDTSVTWYDMPISSVTVGTYREAGFWYQYTTGFHWSFTQMTPGSMQVFPVNSLERWMNIFCLVFGLLVFSSLVSSLSAKSIQYQNKNKAKKDTLDTLRSYLRKAKISPELGMRVQQEVEERLNYSKPLTFGDVQAFAHAPEALRLEVHYWIFHPPLMEHSLFRVFESVDGQRRVTLLQRLCKHAAKLQEVQPANSLFRLGQECSTVRVVITGKVHYHWDQTDFVGSFVSEDPPEHGAPRRIWSNPSMETADRDQLVRLGAVDRHPDTRQTVVQSVGPGGWMSEAALWCRWTHVGTAEAVGVCELVDLYQDQMEATLREHPVLQVVAQQYARSFTMRVKMAEPPNTQWPNDLCVPNATYDEILVSMPTTARVLLGELTLNMLKARTEDDFWAFQKRPNFERLEKEVHNGKTTLVINKDGVISRIAPIVTVRLRREEDDRILVQLGKWDRTEGKAVASCALPGTKMQEGEIPRNSFERLLKGYLAPFSQMIVTSREKTEEIQFSNSHRIDTKYVKHVHNATIDLSFSNSNIVVLRSSKPHVGSASGLQVQVAGTFRRAVSVAQNAGSRSSAASAGNFRRAERPPSTQGVRARSSFGGAGMRARSSLNGVRLSVSEVYVLADGSDHVTLATWLNQDEFDFFTGRDGGPVLKSMMERVELDDGALQAAVNAWQTYGDSPDVERCVPGDGTELHVLSAMYTTLASDEGHAASAD